MMRPMPKLPTLLAVMTPFPHAVHAEDEVATARAMMDQHGIHHLPVLRDGRLAGIVSARDVSLAGDVLERSQGGVGMPVWAICTRDPYVVEIDTRLDVVAEEIANRHIGSALVVKHGKLAGIVTTTDLCRALAEVLRTRLPGGDDVA
jgi:acetoin utilization protein AcuB